MLQSFDHGPRLSETEYQGKIAELYQYSPLVPTKDRERAIRRKELDLTIDHRLGCLFPQERRDALWAIQEQIEKRRLRLAVKYLFRKFFAERIVKSTQNLTNFLVEEYAKVLNPEELQQYFDLQPDENSVLPIDVNQLKKKGD